MVDFEYKLLYIEDRLVEPQHILPLMLPELRQLEVVELLESH
jgi:hypothetical protein